jgi:hypothetical protein
MNCPEKVIDVTYIMECSIYVASSRLTRDSSLETLQGELDLLSCLSYLRVLLPTFVNGGWIAIAHGRKNMPSVFQARYGDNISMKVRSSSYHGTVLTARD